jgi:hypothetical protein
MDSFQRSGRLCKWDGTWNVLQIFRIIDPFACECIVGEGQSKDMQDRTKGKIIISFMKHGLGTV